MKMKDIEQIKIYSDDGLDYVAYYKDPEILKQDYNLMEDFIKKVEKMVREDWRYKRYLAALHAAGILKCAILGNLKTDEIEIEMHHGPIFTLYSVVEIIVKHHIKNKEFMTTFSVADEVLTCHEQNMIQVVGLAKTPHKAWHMNKIFVHIKAAFGDVDKFIDKYRDGLANYHISEALRFIELCKEYEGSIDNDLFEVSKRLSFKKK